MPFGGQIITFIDIDSVGPADSLGQQLEQETRTSAPGCRHRPLSYKETTELGLNVAAQPWRSTIPLFEYNGTLLERVMATKPEDVIEVDGIRYQVDGGIRPHPDMAGRLFKATIISTLHLG